jgi:hypothetical protein
MGPIGVFMVIGTGVNCAWVKKGDNRTIERRGIFIFAVFILS